MANMKKAVKVTSSNKDPHYVHAAYATDGHILRYILLPYAHGLVGISSSDVKSVMKDVKNQAVRDGFKDVHASSFDYIQKKETHRARFRYVVKVVETVESLTAVESDKKLPWNRIKDIAERRRVAGKLSFNGVTDVDMWVCDAYCDGISMSQKDSSRKTGK